MKKTILLLGAFYLISSAAFSQEQTSLKSRITEKELALENSVKSSRQINNTLQAELLDLYIAYKIDLEKEINSTKDENIKSLKGEELIALNNKIEKYSLKN